YEERIGRDGARDRAALEPGLDGVGELHVRRIDIKSMQTGEKRWSNGGEVRSRTAGFKPGTLPGINLEIDTPHSRSKGLVGAGGCQLEFLGVGQKRGVAGKGCDGGGERDGLHLLFGYHGHVIRVAICHIDFAAYRINCHVSGCASNAHFRGAIRGPVDYGYVIAAEVG